MASHLDHARNILNILCERDGNLAAGQVSQPSSDPYRVTRDPWNDVASTVKGQHHNRLVFKNAELHTPSASNSHPKTWSQLPLEIVENVFQWLARGDLRSCRLLDRKSSPAATRILFQTVCVSPNLNSITRLYRISDQPALANLVRVIKVQTHYMVQMPFEKLIRLPPLAQRLQCLDPLDAAAEALKLSAAYDIENSGEIRFQFDGPGTLSAALRNFSRLQHFVHARPSSRSPTGDYLLDQDSDLWSRAGIGLLSQTRQYPLMNSVLQKSRHLRPISLDFTSLYWWEFYNISQIPHLKELLSTVIDFKLTFQVETFDRPECRLRQKNAYWESGLTKYIEQLSSYLPVVERLCLGFDDLSSAHETVGSTCYFASRTISALLLRLKDRWTFFPKLKALTLENMTTTVTELCEFVLPHASTLKSLKIKNMCLDGSRTHGVNAGILCSVIRVVAFFRDYLHFDEMLLQGMLRDHKGVSLICSPGEKDCVLGRVQAYACGRKPIPFKAYSCEKVTEEKDVAEVHLIGNIVVLQRPSDGGYFKVTVESDESWYLTAAEAATGD